MHICNGDRFAYVSPKTSTQDEQTEYSNSKRHNEIRCRAEYVSSNTEDSRQRYIPFVTFDGGMYTLVSFRMR